MPCDLDNCCNVNCEDKDHVEMLDKFIVDLLESIVDSSSCLISDKKHSNSKNTPIFGHSRKMLCFGILFGCQQDVQ